VILQALLSISKSIEAGLKTKTSDTGTGEDGKGSAKAKEGKALIDLLSKIEPHKVKIEYGGDPESYGLHIHRAVAFCSETDLDTGVAGFAMQMEEKKVKVLDMFEAGEDDTVLHYDAETEFASLVNRLLGWAGSHEAKKGGQDTALARADQVRDFNTSWARMKKQLKDFTSRLTRGEEFYRRQVALCATAAFGTIIARAAIKNMNKQDEWRESLQKKYGSTTPSGSKASDPSALTESLIQSITAAVRHQGGLSLGPRGGGGGGGGGGPSWVPPLASPKSGPGPGRRQDGPKAPPPKDTGGNVNVIGLAMPNAKAIVGENMKGSIHKACTCGNCGEAGHEPMECPTLFSATFNNRSLPGWTEAGVKVGSSWNGDKITDACLAQWKRMQNLGFFVKLAGSKKAAPAFETI
jgi:hypothetical protein